MFFNPDSEIYFNLNSPKQVQEFLFDFLKLKPLGEKNDKGNHSVDEKVLTEYAEKHGVEFCKMLLDYRKLMKARNTYVKGVRRKITKGNLIHPDFWIHIAETYRSSSSNLNFY